MFVQNYPNRQTTAATRQLIYIYVENFVESLVVSSVCKAMGFYKKTCWNVAAVARVPHGYFENVRSRQPNTADDAAAKYSLGHINVASGPIQAGAYTNIWCIFVDLD